MMFLREKLFYKIYNFTDDLKLIMLCCFQMRGALCFLVAVISLLLFDHDERLDHLGDHDCILLCDIDFQTRNIILKYFKPCLHF